MSGREGGSLRLFRPAEALGEAQADARSDGSAHSSAGIEPTAHGHQPSRRTRVVGSRVALYSHRWSILHRDILRGVLLTGLSVCPP